MSTDVITTAEGFNNPVAVSNSMYFNPEAFNHIQRVARMFAYSSMVPLAFTPAGNLKNPNPESTAVGNCVIAINLANRLNADPLMVMQNLYIVYGTPSWSSKFLIACFNQTGRFSSLRYEMTGEEGTDERGCSAYAVEISTGEKLFGTKVTIKTAKDEGWFAKNGSKWKTMPEQMLRYRAASWFIKAYAPEIAMGLQTREEIDDVYDAKLHDNGVYTVEAAPEVEDVGKRLKLKASKAKKEAEQPADPAPPAYNYSVGYFEAEAEACESAEEYTQLVDRLRAAVQAGELNPDAKGLAFHKILESAMGKEIDLPVAPDFQ